jgi:hypothetical protein
MSAAARAVVRGAPCPETVRDYVCESLGYAPRDVVSVRVTRKAVVVTYLDERRVIAGPVVHPLTDA